MALVSFIKFTEVFLTCSHSLSSELMTKTFLNIRLYAKRTNFLGLGIHIVLPGSTEIVTNLIVLALLVHSFYTSNSFPKRSQQEDAVPFLPLCSIVLHLPSCQSQFPAFL